MCHFEEDNCKKCTVHFMSSWAHSDTFIWKDMDTSGSMNVWNHKKIVVFPRLGSKARQFLVWHGFSPAEQFTIGIVSSSGWKHTGCWSALSNSFPAGLHHSDMCRFFMHSWFQLQTCLHYFPSSEKAGLPVILRCTWWCFMYVAFEDWESR